LPDISKINNVAVADISKLDSITFAHGMKVNNQDVSLVTDAHTLISTHDIAVLGASATIDITSGITDTYDAYEFRFTNIHPANDSVDFLFQVNAVDLTGFNEVMTTTNFRAVHNESDSATNLGYDTNDDQAQTQLYQSIANYQGFDADQAVSGVLTLYAPSSTTYVKHFTSRVNAIASNDYVNDSFAAGYINVTAAIDEISFKFTSGNIDAGVIKMYGIAKA
jgi:hypothetical protein